jgi:hypothetical protein
MAHRTHIRGDELPGRGARQHKEGKDMYRQRNDTPITDGQIRIHAQL